MKSLIIAALSMVALTADAQAADWWLLGGSTQKDILFADGDSIKADVQAVHVWVWWFNKKGSAAQTKVLYAVRCNDRSIRVEQASSFDRGGLLINADTVNAFSPYEEAIPWING